MQLDLTKLKKYSEAHVPKKTNQRAWCLVNDCVKAGSLAWVYFPSSAELRKRCTIQKGLCVLSLVQEAVGFSIITCERGEALHGGGKGNKGCVSPYTLQSNTDVHACRSSLTEWETVKLLLVVEAAQEVIMVLKNTAVVSTTSPNLC